jgi:hypothetical protein
MSPSSDRPRAPKTASDLALLRRFEPLVRYTRGEHCFPMDVEPYIRQCSLWLHYPDGRQEQLVPAGSLDLKGLVQPRSAPFGSVLFLRFVQPFGLADARRYLAEEARITREGHKAFHPGPGRLSRGGLLPRLFDALFNATLLLRGRVPAATSAAAHVAYDKILQAKERYVYHGRVVRDRGWTVLQYWFFFDYNPWRSGFHGVNDHESDWEMIIVYLYEDGASLVPEWVAFASHDFHGDDLRRRWDDRAELDVVDGHPVVYAGAGSHASYFRRGEYQAEVSLPLPKWLRGISNSLQRSWARLTGQEGKGGTPFRIPFVDFARGDGLAIGPGGDKPWTPVVIDESTPWVSQYRGLWGLFARDPLSGENAPGGPMYNRDGTPRSSWFDPLGFAGLDKTPTPSKEATILRARVAELARSQAKLARAMAGQTEALQEMGAVWKGMEGKPHLAKKHSALGVEIKAKAAELTSVRKDYSQNQVVLDGLNLRLKEIQRDAPTDPQAHIQHRASPVPASAVSGAVEMWAAISIALMFFAVAALLIWAPSFVLPGIVVLIIAFGLVESMLRRTFAASVGNVAILLALVSLIVLGFAYWQVALAGLLAFIGVVLIGQRIRELRG